MGSMWAAQAHEPTFRPSKVGYWICRLIFRWDLYGHAGMAAAIRIRYTEYAVHKRSPVLPRIDGPLKPARLIFQMRSSTTARITATQIAQLGTYYFR